MQHVFESAVTIVGRGAALFFVSTNGGGKYFSIVWEKQERTNNVESADDPCNFILADSHRFDADTCMVVRCRPSHYDHLLDLLVQPRPGDVPPSYGASDEATVWIFQGNPPLSNADDLAAFTTGVFNPSDNTVGADGAVDVEAVDIIGAANDDGAVDVEAVDIIGAANDENNSPVLDVVHSSQESIGFTTPGAGGNNDGLRLLRINQLRELCAEENINSGGLARGT